MCWFGALGSRVTSFLVGAAMAGAVGSTFIWREIQLSGQITERAISELDEHYRKNMETLKGGSLNRVS